MVQGLSNQSSIGSINRIGMSPEGRAIYQVNGSDGKIAGNLSVAQKDCDTFEKAYNDMIVSAGKLQQYAATHNEEDMKKMKKASKWIIGLSAFAGGAICMFKKNMKYAILKTVGASILGLAAGVGISLATMTPPGSIKLAKASKIISKLDIQPYNGNK